jgi:DNA-directed RNA polymerase
MMVGAEFLMTLNKPFYYSCSIDYRGRLYYNCNPINPQSSSLAQSLIEFSDVVDCVNPVRFDCVKDEMENYINISNAKSYVDDPYAYISKIYFNDRNPYISLRKDSTSSYLQIIGVMFNDKEFMKMGNLTTGKYYD